MQYIVRGANGKEYGPIDLPTLIEWVRQGRVSPDSKVRNLTNGMLLNATHMPELTGMFGANQKQTAAINSGFLYGQSGTDPHAERWEDYKFVILMSVFGIFFSMVLSWFALIFCAIAMKRAYEAAREQRPMAGIGFSIALLSSLAVIAIPFLMHTWISHLFFSDDAPKSKCHSVKWTREESMTSKEFYDDNGYFVAKGVFNAAEIAELESDFDHIVHQISSTGENINARWSGPEVDRLGATELFIAHTHNVQQFSAAWLRAFLHPKFLGVTKELIGEDIILHHSKLFQKPAEKGAAFPMHQDWEYFPTEQDSMMAGIIHVSQATEEMGCFRVYPGTHKLGRIGGTSGNKESDLLANYPIEGSTPLVAEPGDVVFFHYCLIHGSLPNTSQNIRKTVLTQMHSGKDRVIDGCTHPNARLTLNGWNYHSSRSSANND